MESEMKYKVGHRSNHSHTIIKLNCWFSVRRFFHSLRQTNIIMVIIVTAMEKRKIVAWAFIIWYIVWFMNKYVQQANELKISTSWPNLCSYLCVRENNYSQQKQQRKKKNRKWFVFFNKIKMQNVVTRINVMNIRPRITPHVVFVVALVIVLRVKEIGCNLDDGNYKNGLHTKKKQIKNGISKFMHTIEKSMLLP